ncbi:MAG: hypothetical protein EOM23_00250 [Candidatus Moranbacteria bacterium]|nr:hypothetical protein [Candidatus Moranbacteria bacterium]
MGPSIPTAKLSGQPALKISKDGPRFYLNILWPALLWSVAPYHPQCMIWISRMPWAQASKSPIYPRMTSGTHNLPTLTCTYRGKNGEISGQAKQITIPPMGAVQQSLKELLGAVDGGTMTISSSEAITAFLLYDGTSTGGLWRAGLSVLNVQ